MTLTERLSEFPEEIASEDVIELRKALVRIQKQDIIGKTNRAATGKMN